jgi:eukaryotic-like serine/threonine-protein kinase
MDAFDGISRSEMIGNYRLRKPLATGVNSQVYEVVELNSNIHFAMKLLLPEKVGDEELRKDLLHEAAVSMQLAHPNVIRVVHVDKSPKNPYFVMEFFPTSNLKDRLNAAVKFPRQAEFLRAQGQSILKQAATAFAFINAKGWIHRDIKPDNILVNSAGEVRVIDLAIAERIQSGIGSWFHKKDKLAAGTLSYMSPEQLRCERLDYRADIYSFGATAYELVAGRPPFRAATQGDLMQKHLHEKALPPRAYNPMITKEFDELVMAMLDKDRDKRPRNFHEVLMRMRKMHMYMRPKKPKPPDAAV